MAILGNFETTMIQKQFKVILINYKENYDTTTTTIQWVLTSVQFNLVCFLSQSGSWEILVRVAIPTRTVCARGLATRTEHWFWFIFLCAWLSHAHVYSIQRRFPVVWEMLLLRVVVLLLVLLLPDLDALVPTSAPPFMSLV